MTARAAAPWCFGGGTVITVLRVFYVLLSAPPSPAEDVEDVEDAEDAEDSGRRRNGHAELGKKNLRPGFSRSRSTLPGYMLR